jgi:hypothetical protein
MRALLSRQSQPRHIPEHSPKFWTPSEADCGIPPALREVKRDGTWQPDHQFIYVQKRNISGEKGQDFAGAGGTDKLPE